MMNNQFKMSKIHILEQLLDEGQSVRGMALGILSRAGVKDAEGVLDTLASLPVSNDLGARTIAQVDKNEKALIPVVNWYVGARDWSQPYTDRDEASVIEDIGDAVRKIYSYETTRNYNGGLTAIQARYRTLGKLNAWLEAESKDNRNIKMDKGGYNFPELLAYSDKGVDVYKASNPMEAIALSKGYSFCIGQPGGNNMFYSYRNDPKDATAYFCWFKDEQGRKNHEDMCVLHVGSDGRYRLTGSGNHGSPIVDKQRVLNGYPALRGALESGKLTADEYSEDEKAVQHIRPMSLVELNNTTKGYTPTSIAILIGKGCVFSDDFFDYVWEEVDKGRYRDAGYDSLIRKYVLAGFTRLSPHQKEVLEGAGYSREVQASEVRYKRHWVQEQMAYFERLIEQGMLVMVEREDGYHIESQSGAIIKLYSPLDKDIVIDGAHGIQIKGPVWDDNSIKSIRIGYFPIRESVIQFTITDNDTLTRIELNPSFKRLYTTDLYIQNCARLETLEGLALKGVTRELELYALPKLKGLKGIESFSVVPTQIKIRHCASLESLEGLDTAYGDNDLQLSLEGLPDLHNLKHLPKSTNLFHLDGVPVNSVEGIEWLLDKADPDYREREIIGKVAYSIMDFYNKKYDVMRERIPAHILAKLYPYVRVAGNNMFADGVEHYRGEVPPKGAKTIVINGHTYLNRRVDHMDTSKYIPKLVYMPKKVNILEYNNNLCPDLEGITPDIGELTISPSCIGNLHSLRGIRKVDMLLLYKEIPAEWINSLVDDNDSNIRIIYLSVLYTDAKKSDALVDVLARYIKNHQTTIIQVSYYAKSMDMFDLSKKLKSKIPHNVKIRESHTPVYHNLMHTLNAVNEAGFMDKVSGYLDKVDPDRSKMRGLAKTALALMGGGELDDSVGLIKDRRDASHVDTDQAEDILRDAVLKLGRTTSEINAFLRLPEKERTEKVKKALQEVIYKQYKVSRSEGRVLERELYAKIKRSLWDNYKVTLGESLSKPSQSPDGYNHTTHPIKVSHRANTSVSEGLPPTVNFEGEVMELTTTECDHTTSDTTESNEIQDIVDNVQRLIEKDMSEDDLTSPAGQKELMKLCLRFAKSDKAKAKKAFVQLLKQFDTK